MIRATAWFTTPLLVLCAASMVEARTWKSPEGKELIADYVDVDETHVTLRKSDGKEIRVSLEKLCDEDQIFLKGLLARKNSKPAAKLTPKSGSPFEDSSSSDSSFGSDADEDDDKPTSTSAGKKKSSGETREWTDVTGKTFKGKFVRFQGRAAMILRGGRQIPTDFFLLSQADQEYLKEWAAANGQSQLVPQLNASNVAGNGTTMPSAGYTAPTTTTTSTTTTTPSSTYTDPAALAARMNQIEAQRAATPTTTYTPPSSTYTPPPSNNTYPTTASTTTPGYMPPPNTTSSGSTYNPPPPMTTSTSTSTTTPSYYAPPPPQLKECGSCKNVIPGHLTAGDTCPHCGVTFTHDQVTGSVSHSAMAAGMAWKIGGGIGAMLVVAIIVGVVKTVLGGGSGDDD
jgi:hypothetical protein